MPKLKKTPPNVKQLQDHLTDLDNRFKRALADYQNLEKRHLTQKQSYIKYANESLLDKLLSILDDLERAQTHLQDPGLKIVLDQFNQLLISESVTPIDAKGQPFDPESMDCLEVTPGPKDTVTRVLTKGYLYHDRVLRPAQVEVGSGKKISSPTN